MSVGSGSIKRAAKKATETPAQTEVKEAVIGQPDEQTVQEVAAMAKPEKKKQASKKPSKADESKSDASKPAAEETSGKKEKIEPANEGKEFMADEVKKSTDEICQLTQELPVYLL